MIVYLYFYIIFAYFKTWDTLHKYLGLPIVSYSDVCRCVLMVEMAGPLWDYLLLTDLAYK